MIIAIHKDTKEHRHVFSRNAYFYNEDADEWRYVEADTEGWIKRFGEECPLPGGTRCYVAEDDWESSGALRAENWSWSRVTAYLPILDDKSVSLDGGMLRYEGAYRKMAEQSPAWDGGLPPVGVECEAHYTHGATKRWLRAEVLKRGARECAVFIPEINALGWCSTFRPIRSEEEREIDDLAGAILDTVNRDGIDFHHDEKVIAKRLREMGYRKQEAL